MTGTAERPGPSSQPQPSHQALGPVVLIGAGLVGASVGCALTAAGVQVHVTDLVGSHARVAASRGAGTLSRPEPAVVRLVVVAVPPRALVEVIESALTRYPNATVTDVGSVKAAVVTRLAMTTGRDRYVGSHPMAGSHHAGPLTAQADLFEDRTWVLAPHAESAAASIAHVRAMIELCGARAVELSPSDHDQAVARVSHLPHLMSALMAGSLPGTAPEYLRLAGQGLRDVTRIAGSDPKLWEQIIELNAASLRPELIAMQERLASLIDGLEDSGRLLSHLESGFAGTQEIPGKHGRTVADYAEVVVEIPDAPGALSRLFADIDVAGINVEDMSIEHDAVREVGYLSLSVTADHQVELLAAMEASGWDLRA